MKSMLLVGLILVGATVGACGKSNNLSAELAALKKTTDMVAINQIEVTWHKAASTKNVDSLMSLWTDNGVWTVGGQTFVGKSQIRNFLVTTAAPFQPANHWISETPAYKNRVTVSGDRGTLYFECHFADVKTRQIKVLVALDAKVARISGHWLITNAVNEAGSLN